MNYYLTGIRICNIHKHLQDKIELLLFTPMAPLNLENYP